MPAGRVVAVEELLVLVVEDPPGVLDVIVGRIALQIHRLILEHNVILGLN